MVVLRASAADSSDYLMDLWTSDDDLPDTSVTTVTQTSDGYLWIGTYNGLARFDGVRFTNFDPANTPALQHARVNHLFTDSRGTLWINTYDGSMTSFRNGVFAHEWHGAEVVGVFSTSNRIYFATIASGVGVRTENSGGSNQWQTINFDAQHTGARLFCQDAAGALWCLLRDGRIERIVGTNVVRLPGDVGVEDQKINYLTADHAGGIWVGTDKKILRWNGERFDDETPTNGQPDVATTFLFCTASNGVWAFANNSVRHAVNRRWIASTESWSDLVQADPQYVHAYEERNGNVWFRQYGHGLFCAGTDGKFSRISSANGLPDNRVSCWFQDREGNVWVGMDRGGLARLRKRQFQIVSSDTLKNFPVATVCEDSLSNVWIGTFDHGLNRWHDGRLDRINLPAGANKSAFFSAFPDAQNRLWLSADREDLFALETNGAPSTSLHRVDSVHGIKVIFADSKGRVWLGRQTQLSCWTNGEVLNFGTRNGFERCDVRALAEDRQGNIWIGAGNGALYRFAGGKFSAFRPSDNSTNQAIWSLFPDEDGTIWAGTFRGGLLRFKGGKFTRYTSRDGLPDNIICQIADDGFGKLWFGSHKGIFCVAKNSFASLDRGEIPSLPCAAYGLFDGLPTLECSGNYQPSAWRGHDGRLWFATVKGAVVADPRQVRPNPLPPPVVIEKFQVDGKDVSLAATRENARSTGTGDAAVEIPPGKHGLDFQFTALSFISPDKVHFRYQLVGFDNGWVEAGTKRTAHYGPLQPGDYKFRVTACNNSGVWNETGASIELKQLPFFWQTWWFVLLAAFAAVAAISGTARYVATRHLRNKLERLKQQRTVERERERIAKDIHDDLGAGLTHIMLQSSLARRGSQSEIQNDLTQISETARDLVRAMDEIVWAVNPENDTLDGLVTYVGKYVKDFSTATKLRCKLNLPPEAPAIAVSAETRHNLFLAIKEALNNVAKHSRATEVSFQLKVLPDAFAFVIKDNGVGFVPGAEREISTSGERLSSGHGLPNLAQRLEQIGGQCSVASQPGKGTQIELKLPIIARRAPALK
jgi:signal transduction histidine kinase/ligand-binding sensor domain-containing protein